MKNGKNSTWKIYAFWILLSEAVGGIAGLLSRQGTKIYEQSVLQPPLSPPAIVFPIVWVILYALMGIGAARISISGDTVDTHRALTLFGRQLFVNFLWPLIFFVAQSYGFALIWLIVLWIMVLGMILAFQKIDPVAAKLQIPYLIWLTFAAYLNLGVWYLNR